EAGMPERATSEMLATAVLSAIETARFLPREVRISHLQWEACLESLARELGFAVRMVKRLPAAEEAKESVLAAMGDPGPLIACRLTASMTPRSDEPGKGPLCY